MEGPAIGLSVEASKTLANSVRSSPRMRSMSAAVGANGTVGDFSGWTERTCWGQSLGRKPKASRDWRERRASSRPSYTCRVETCYLPSDVRVTGIDPKDFRLVPSAVRTSL